MNRVFAMYHERMFYFWYGRNNMMRDYHGKKYHQIQSFLASVDSGMKFRSYRNEAVFIVQSVSVVISFVALMLACVAQFG